MTNKLTKNNWEPFVYHQLNQLIKNHSSKNKPSDYVVFDFDNTSLIHDIEDHLMMYMVQFLLFKMTPKEFNHLLRSGEGDYSATIDSKAFSFSFDDLVTDIIDSYQYLYSQYIFSQKQALEVIHQSTHFKNFQAKLRLFYNLANQSFERKPGHFWPLFFFQGNSPTSLDQLAYQAVEWGLNLPIELKIYRSSADILGKTGVVEADFEQGLVFSRELINLYQVFQTNGIGVYIISASPVGLVQAIASRYDFKLPSRQIYGMEYVIDNNNKITAKLKAKRPLTKGDGKVQTIQKYIAPHYNNRSPIATFGDSMGDYPMMTSLEGVKLSVLFNRYMNNDTQKIISQAKETYGKPTAKYVVQGRDENSGSLIPSFKTIPYHHTQAILSFKEYDGIKTLSE